MKLLMGLCVALFGGCVGSLEADSAGKPEQEPIYAPGVSSGSASVSGVDVVPTRTYLVGPNDSSTTVWWHRR